MTVPRRMALALCCLLLAMCFLVLTTLVIAAVHHGLHNALKGWDMWLVYLMFAIPGWLCALPFVWLFKDVEGYRAWLVLAIGTVIGPAFMSLMSLPHARGGHMNWQQEGFGIIMSLEIGFLTSAFYVILLLLFTRSRTDTLR